MIKRFLPLLLLCGMCAAQTTPNLNLNIPVPGTQTNTWGPLINFNFTQLDSYLGGTAPLPGNLSVNGALTAGAVNASSATIASLFSTTATVGTGNFTAALNQTGVGVFTNMQYNYNTLVNIGGMNIPNVLHTFLNGGSTNWLTDGITAAVAMPIGATAFQTNAMSAYVTNGAGTNVFGVGIYPSCVVTASNGFCWGSNPIVNCAPGISGCNLHGEEVDVNVNNASDVVNGIVVQGAWNATPAGNPVGVLVFAPIAAPGRNWGAAFGTSPGASPIGLQLSPTAFSFPASSQDIQFLSYNSGGTAIAGISSDLNGTIVLSSQTPRGVQIPAANFPLTTTGVNKGTILYCTTCKNVVDDGATAGAACLGSGNGAVAKFEGAGGGRWDCN